MVMQIKLIVVVVVVAFIPVHLTESLPACRRLLFLLLHAEKGRLRNAVANRLDFRRLPGPVCDLPRRETAGRVTR